MLQLGLWGEKTVIKYLERTLLSPVSSSRSSEDRTVPGAMNIELSTWSTCFLFSFFLLLVDSSITFSSKRFAKFSEVGSSWDLRTRQPNTSQHFVLRGRVSDTTQQCSVPPRFQGPARVSLLSLRLL